MAVGRTPSGLSPKEMQLYRLLAHTADCTDHPCAQCEDVLRKLEDGPQHFLEDHELRLERLLKVLENSVSVSSKLADAAESAPVQPAFRRAVIWLHEALTACVKLIREPIYSKPEEVRRAAEAAKPVRVRTPVTIITRPREVKVVRERRAVTLRLLQGGTS